MGWKLLVLSLLAYGLLATEEEYGSGMGSADGSDEGCIEPVPRPGLLGGTVATAGNLEPRCHLACIERVRRKLAMHIVKNCKLYTLPNRLLWKRESTWRLVLQTKTFMFIVLCVGDSKAPPVHEPKVIQAKYGHLRVFHPVANFANSNDSAERMLVCTATGGVTTPRDHPFPQFGY